MTLAAAMLMGRFIYVIPLLAVAGSLAQKKRSAPSAGSVPTQSPLFIGLLVGVVLIMGGAHLFSCRVARTRGRAGRNESRHFVSESLIIQKSGPRPHGCSAKTNA